MKKTLPEGSRFKFFEPVTAVLVRDSLRGEEFYYAPANELENGEFLAIISISPEDVFVVEKTKGSYGGSSSRTVWAFSEKEKTVKIMFNCLGDGYWTSKVRREKCLAIKKL